MIVVHEKELRFRVKRTLERNSSPVSIYQKFHKNCFEGRSNAHSLITKNLVDTFSFSICFSGYEVASSNV